MRRSLYENVLTIYEAINVPFLPGFYLVRIIYFISGDGDGNCFGGCLIFIDPVSRFVYVGPRRRQDEDMPQIKRHLAERPVAPNQVNPPDFSLNLQYIVSEIQCIWTICVDQPILSRFAAILLILESYTFFTQLFE